MTEELKKLASEEDRFDEMERIYIDWQKKFVAGEQNTLISDQGATYQAEKQYYWQQLKVYNILKPIIDQWVESGRFGGDIWGKGKAVDQLIPYQLQYNAYKNQIADMTKQLSLPIMFVEDGSLDVDALEEEGLCPGKIIIYRQGSQKCPIFESIVSRDDIEFINHLADNLKIEMEQLADQLFENIDKDKDKMTLR